MVVGFSPGGSPDIIARMLAVKLQDSLGQPIVVENRPGATGNIGADAVAKSAPDGYTTLMGTVSVAIAVSLTPKPPFDPLTDLEPVGMVASLPLLAVIHPSVPANTLKELADYARAKPGALNFGSVGHGSPHHLAGELLSNLANAKMVHVPYKGGGAAVQALLAQEIQLLFISPLAGMPQVRAGKLRALAFSGPRRSPAAPDVLTVAEAGWPGLQADNWHALFAARGTPKPIVDRLNAELNRLLSAPDVREQLMSQQGAEAWTTTPEELRNQVRADIDKWAKVLATAGAPKQ
jgi:tripartite-type tricarboxylate transporter receptor subunit TctC